MKLRASFGIINTDNIPYNGYWNTTMNGSGGGYPIQDNFGNGGAWQEGTLPSLNGTTEKPINIMWVWMRLCLADLH